MPIDWTSLILQVILGLFGIITPAALIWIQHTVKSTQDANTLGNATVNALGAMKQAAMSAVAAGVPPSKFATSPVRLSDGTTADLEVGIRYVKDHAGPEAAKFRIDDEAIADKLRSRIGNVMLEPTSVVVVTPAGGNNVGVRGGLPYGLGGDARSRPLPVTPSAPAGDDDATTV